jgi:hypothetical protein
MDFAPQDSVKRALLERKIAEYRAQGYDLALEAIAAEVQDPGPSKGAKESLAAQVRELTAKSDNAYRAAKRLQALLDELPEEKKEEGEA